MHTIDTITRTGREKVTVYDINDYPYEHHYKVCKSKHYSYIGTPATFDIETSKFVSGYDPTGSPIWKSIMYHWQFCMNGCVCFGRTWEEYRLFRERIAKAYKLGDKQKLIVFVHNLAFEYQHLLWYEKWHDIFATGPRDIITARTDIFEYRCSYYLSNMTLAKYCENSSKCVHIKAKGDLDYEIFRTSETQLTNEEEGYCYNDVKGLEECVLQEIEHETNIASLPLTSTGFVRRDCRISMKKRKKNRKEFEDSKLTLEQLVLLHDAFRGGNTCSNRSRTGTSQFMGKGKDIASSYPGNILLHEYPYGRWMEAEPETISDLDTAADKFATCAYYLFENIRTNAPMPYIPRAKCLQLDSYVNCNGRILQAKRLVIALTDVDWRIIRNQYEFDSVQVSGFIWSFKKRLPKELLETMVDYFYKKSILKGVEGKEYEYGKAKNKLNSVYGMMVSYPIKYQWSTNSDGEWIETRDSSDEQMLLDYYENRNSFLSYQWGVWVTAYGREQLQRMLDKVGMDAIYCDTDSIKYIGDHDKEFVEENARINARFESIGVKNYVDVNGKRKYIGTWDDDGEWEEFRTLGAKKYCYRTYDGKLHITVAGLSKEKGAAELEREGGIPSFKIGKVFTDSGRTVAHYHNDHPHIEIVDGQELEVSSGIAITDTTYTLGVTDEYLDIISKFWDETL